MSGVKNGLFTGLIAVASLMPVFSNAQPPSPGGNPKTEKTENADNPQYIVNGVQYPDAGVAGLVNSEGGNSMSVIVYKGEDNANLTDKSVAEYLENDMRSKGANGKCFVESGPGKYTGYMIYVNGLAEGSHNLMGGDQFLIEYPKAITKQIGLGANKLVSTDRSPR